MSDAVLVVVLLAPLAGVVLALAAVEPAHVVRWTTVGCAIAAAGAIGLLVADRHPTVGRLEPDPLALAASAGTALLALAVVRSGRGPAISAAVTIAIAYLGTGAPHGVDGTARATAVVVVAAAVAMAAAIRPHHYFALAVPSALVLGLRAAPTVEASSAGRWVAVGLAGAAAAAALFRRSSWCAALVPWPLVAAVAPIPSSSARALAAGAVLALILGDRRASLAVLPGAAAFAYVLADSAGWPRPALGALLLVTAAGLARPTHEERAVVRDPVDAVAVALAIWLVLRPESWSWLGLDDLSPYTEGATLAAATTLVVVVLGTLRPPLAGSSHAR